jgi:choline-sulfatase
VSQSNGASRRGVTRRQVIGTGARAVPALMLAQGLSGTAAQRALAATGNGGGRHGMNVLVFLTDQERAVQHFPPGWARENLPGAERLRRQGLTFENAFTNSCMCSPARSTWLSGYFPAQHRVKYTLEEDMHPPRNPQVPLASSIKNQATVASAAGYSPVYKGKWHLSKPAGRTFQPSDVARYGFSRWDPPDGGANQDPDQAGGGFTNHDGRYMHSVGSVQEGNEGVLQYLGHAAATQQPFYLIVSLVNPHDVLSYPSNYHEFGYDDSWLQGAIEPPETVDEDLLTKPAVQRQFLNLFNVGNGTISGLDMQRAYLNFYGNLMKSSDGYLVEILDELERTGLLDNTLVIKTADHGEMGLAHGGLRQKNFNFYEESLRVPLVYSNPKLFPEPRSCDALVSHVDFLPTMASLLGAPARARAPWHGVDYSRLIRHPDAPPVQDYVVFTFDDYQSGQKNPPYPQPPNHLVAIRERRWKLAKYYDPSGATTPQWEMYDLKTDPLEQTNIAFPGHKRTHEQERQLRRLKRKLARVQRTRLRH